MTKLDEIETRIQNTLFVQVGEPRAKHPYFKGEYARLLIRAVRQLTKGKRYKNGCLVDDIWVPYDPDVLELIDE